MVEYILAAILVLLTALYSVWILMLLRPNSRKSGKYSPAVSILIPAHNEEKYIDRTIKALLSDNYPKKEIIVIDDGSTDRTSGILGKFGKRIIVIKMNHAGKAAALNTALRKAKNEIVITLDADSELGKGSISELVKPLHNADIGGSTGIIRARRNRNPLTWFQDYEYIMSSGWRYASTNINGNSIVPGFAAFRKSALEEIGGFGSDTLTEDFDIVVSLKRAGYDTVTVKTASITTNVPQSVPALVRQRLRWGRGTIQVIRKHLGFLASGKSESLGRFTIPTQLYWYVHSLVYVPIIIYMMMLWSQNVPAVAAGDYFSFQFAQYLFSIVSVYGIIDLVIKVATHQYALTSMIALSLTAFFISFVYTLLVFVKISRPSKRVLVAYVFFFPYAIFNSIVLGVSLFQNIINPEKGNKWED